MDDAQAEAAVAEALKSVGLNYAEVRGKRLPMRVSPMPFTPHRYHR